MKKTVFAALAALLGSAAYAAEPQQPASPPVLHLGAVDADNPANGFLPEANKLYRSQPKRHLCWVAMNIPNLGNEATAVEVFSTPKKASFTDAQSSADGKQHRIVTRLPVLRGDNHPPLVQKCWQFEKSDPLGTHSLQVQVNDIIYPAQTFQLLR